jgi:predicted HD phosphohydrolase
MTGSILRDEGVARVDRATGGEWRDSCDAVIRTMAQSGLPFTAEDVRDWVGEPHHPNAWGARFLDARRSGIVDRIGYRTARRPEAHARVVAIYKGKEAA